MRFTLFLGVAAAVWRLFFYLRPLRNVPVSQPATTYDEARQRVAQLVAQETDAINPLCRTRLLTHGYKTARVVILVHGFTNCPQQFCQLAERLYARGDNVLNLRLPRHGAADRLAPDLVHLTAEELVAATAAAIDLAHGLGEQVTLLGFSLGGILAGWAAQHRADLDGAVLVSPAVGFKTPALRLMGLVANGLGLWPNYFQWWDPARKAERLGPGHAYAGFASRALSELLRLALLVRRDAAHQPPVARQITVITNPTDEMVDEQAVAALVAAWQRHGTPVTTHAFPADWQLIHDLMDPTQPAQQVRRVYPQLLAWVG
jgi:carboxylesterase